jgi:hypothetical protein
MNAMTEYKEYTDGDKQALRDLIVYAKAQTGKDVKTGDMIAAVSPGLETPVELKGL